MAGRNKQPIALVQAKGKKHLTKAEIEQRQAEELEVPSDNIRAPAILTKKQAEEFERIAVQLIDLKIMTNLDTDALARFIISKDMYERATRQMRRAGTWADPKVLASTSKVQDRYFKACRAAAGDLGLTITSRCKIVAPKKEDTGAKINKFKKFEKRADGAG